MCEVFYGNPMGMGAALLGNDRSTEIKKKKLLHDNKAPKTNELFCPSCELSYSLTSTFHVIIVFEFKFKFAGSSDEK